MEELIAKYVPDYIDQLNDLLPQLAQFFGGGVLIAFLFWIIGFTVYSVYGWLMKVSS